MKIATVFFFLCLGLVSNVHSIDWYGQSKQDQYLYKRFFKNSPPGFFVELGAYDGISISNTYAFEKHFGWKGICIEPMLAPFELLKQNRKAICINKCISDKKETKTFQRIRVNDDYKASDVKAVWTEMLSGVLEDYHPKQIKRMARWIETFEGDVETFSITTTTLQSIFDELNISHIDLLSLDTEGTELKILKGVDFSKTSFKVILVENNFTEPYIKNFLAQKGYVFERRIGQDDVYYNPKFF